MDRQLEEALAYGPDPLHLATIFGIRRATAIRYTAQAKQLLVSSGSGCPASAGSDGRPDVP